MERYSRTTKDALAIAIKKGYPNVEIRVNEARTGKLIETLTNLCHLTCIQEWLREEHQVNVLVERVGGAYGQTRGYMVNVFTGDNRTVFSALLGGIHKSYEEAFHIGILKALDILKPKPNAKGI